MECHQNACEPSLDGIQAKGYRAMAESSYMDSMGFSTPEEAFTSVKDWSSGLSDREHLARSTIQDIQLTIEIRLKHILYEILKPAVFKGNDEAVYRENCRKVEKMLGKLNFGVVIRILEPILKATEVPEFDDIHDVNEVRGQVTHKGNLSEVEYKGLNPIDDAEGLAHLFSDAFYILQSLTKFEDAMIQAPKMEIEFLVKYYEDRKNKGEEPEPGIEE